MQWAYIIQALGDVRLLQVSARGHQLCAQDAQGIQLTLQRVNLLSQHLVGDREGVGGCLKGSEIQVGSHAGSEAAGQSWSPGAPLRATKFILDIRLHVYETLLNLTVTLDPDFILQEWHCWQDLRNLILANMNYCMA